MLIYYILEFTKIRVSKVHRKLRSPVDRSRIRPQHFMVSELPTLQNFVATFV